MNQHLIYKDTNTSISITSTNVDNFIVKVNGQIITVPQDSVQQDSLQDSLQQVPRTHIRRNNPISQLLMIGSIILVGLTINYFYQK